MKTALAVCLATVLVLQGAGDSFAAPVLVNNDDFPVPFGVFQSVGGTGFGGVGTEIVSMSIENVRPTGSVELPGPGTSYGASGFFDVFFEFDLSGSGSFNIDSFFDVFTELSVDGGSGGPGTVQTEIVSMSLTGGVTGLHIREDPVRPSTGVRTTTPVPGTRDLFWIDSFFDVFLELSVDGGQTWVPAIEPVRLELTRVIPEPATLSLFGLGLAGLVAWRRRRRAAA